jgi:uncharacterized membrane protein
MQVAQSSTLKQNDDQFIVAILAALILIGALLLYLGIQTMNVMLAIIGIGVLICTAAFPAIYTYWWTSKVIKDNVE